MNKMLLQILPRLRAIDTEMVDSMMRSAKWFLLGVIVLLVAGTGGAIAIALMEMAF
jgi:hypothetical protein